MFLSRIANSAAIQALSNRNFGIYTLGNSLSLMGLWVQRLAIGVLMWELTQSPAWLGTIAMAEFIPILLLTPLSGVLADRFDRRTWLMKCLAASSLQAAALFILTIGGWITPQWIVALSLYSGATFALNSTARLTLVPMMLPRENLNSAIAITSIIFNLARFVGPALGGVIIAQIGIAAAFAFNALSFGAIILALSLIVLPQPQKIVPRTGSLLAMVFEDLIAGARYTVRHVTIGEVILLIVVGAVFGRAFIDLIPGIADTAYGRGDPGSVSIFISALGLGAIFAGLWLANRRSIKGMSAILTWGVLVNALCVLVFVSTDYFWLGAFVLAIAGFAQVASGTGSQTLLQGLVEEEMRGRVMALWSLTARGGPALGALLGGWIAESLGFTLPLITGALLTLIIGLIITRGPNKVTARWEKPHS